MYPDVGLLFQDSLSLKLFFDIKPGQKHYSGVKVLQHGREEFRLYLTFSWQWIISRISITEQVTGRNLVRLGKRYTFLYLRRCVFNIDLFHRRIRVMLAFKIIQTMSRRAALTYWKALWQRTGREVSGCKSSPGSGRDHPICLHTSKHKAIFAHSKCLKTIEQMHVHISVFGA